MAKTHMTKAEQEEARRQDELEFENDLASILDSAPGRRVMWYLMDKCKTFSSSFSTSNAATYYNEGRRSIGQLLFISIMGVDPSAYFKMIEDQKGKIDG